MNVPETDAVTAPPPAAIRSQLAAEFPAWDFAAGTDDFGRSQFTATAKQLGTHPHTYSSSDPDRVRAALAAGQ